MPQARVYLIAGRIEAGSGRLFEAADLGVGTTRNGFDGKLAWSQDMSGWRLASVRGAQTYVFSGLAVQPGQICRLYTNEVHAEWCGLSWGKATAQWNNTGDRANLLDATGKIVSSIGYGGQ